MMRTAIVLVLLVAVPLQAQWSGLTAEELARFHPDWRNYLASCETVTRQMARMELRCPSDSLRRITVDVSSGAVLTVQSRRGYWKQILLTAASIIGGAAAAWTATKGT